MIEVIFVQSFPLIYAVHPMKNFVLHLLPFHLLIWAWMIDAIRMLAYGVQHRFKQLGYPLWWQRVEIVFALCFIIISIWKIYFQMYYLVGSDYKGSVVLPIIDMLWMLYAFGFQTIKQIVLICFFNSRLERIRLIAEIPEDVNKVQAEKVDEVKEKETEQKLTPEQI